MAQQKSFESEKNGIKLAARICLLVLIVSLLVKFFDYFNIGYQLQSPIVPQNIAYQITSHVIAKATAISGGLFLSTILYFFKKYWLVVACSVCTLILTEFFVYISPNFL